MKGGYIMPDGRNPSDLINYLYKTACNTSYCCGYLKGTKKVYV